MEGVNSCNGLCSITILQFMASEDTYYYITHSSSQRQLPEVMKWNENFTLAVEENVDYRQVIDLVLISLSKKHFEAGK